VSIAIDRVHRRLFIRGPKPKMVVIMDADSGEIIGQPFPIGDRVDANVYDPETGLITAATREGTLHIIHEDSPDKYSVVETAKTEFWGQDDGARCTDPQPLPHHIGFWSGTGPHHPTAQSAASRYPGNVSPSDLWALTRQLNPIGKTASPRGLCNSRRILLRNENRAQVQIESNKLDAKS
jgi:hypothetical protein